LVALTLFSLTAAFAQNDTTQNPVTDSQHISEIKILKDTVPTSINPDLEYIFNAKNPKQYTITGIQVTGSTSFDPNLIISISGLAVGDKVVIPGGDAFAKAIHNLWKQGLVSDVQVYITQLTGTNINIEINITDRPALTNFKFKGINKSEQEDLLPKIGLAKGKLTRVTESLKTNASDVIKKFFYR